jgi:hypothetical protein
MKADIVIPLELANPNYTLEEIGAMVIIMCFPHLDEDTLETWSKDKDLKEILCDLKDEGIIIVHEDKGEWGELEIDLTKYQED